MYSIAELGRFVVGLFPIIAIAGMLYSMVDMYRAYRKKKTVDVALEKSYSEYLAATERAEEAIRRLYEAREKISDNADLLPPDIQAVLTDLVARLDEAEDENRRLREQISAAIEGRDVGGAR